MPTSPSRRPAPARRALVEDVRQNRSGWVRHGAAALAVSVLGLGIASSFALTGNAENTDPGVRTAVEGAPAVSPRPPANADAQTDTSVEAAKVKSRADQRAEELAQDQDTFASAETRGTVQARNETLKSAAAQAQRRAAGLAEQRRAARLAAARETPAVDQPETPAPPRTDAAAPSPTADNQASPTSGGKSCLPAASYRIAATFGQVGVWARYHTGLDFSAPVGTPLRAPAAGVVTNAGSGPASGWAGNYVAIEYPDGTQSLMAHMSTVSVSTGQRVSGCQQVGAVGMTGRTFGPHVHFEIYPPGITPGDVYRAVNPVGWLKAHGLNP